MFERFTESARQVIILAHEEARALRHDHIGTEHMLLAVVGIDEAGATQILLGLDADRAKIRQEVLRLMTDPAGPGCSERTAQLPDVGATSDTELDRLLDELVEQERRGADGLRVLRGQIDILRAEREHRRGQGPRPPAAA